MNENTYPDENLDASVTARLFIKAKKCVGEGGNQVYIN